MSIKAGVLFPDTLYLHGERGNVLALKEMAKKAGTELEVTAIALEDDFHPDDFDLLYMPAGEIVRATSIVSKLKPYREKINAFIREGKPLIVTGTSAAYFGEKILRQNGTEIEGLGLLPVVFRENKMPYGDDLWINTVYNGRELELVGTQIMMADWSNCTSKPFGRIVYGYGNNEGKDEGIKIHNSFFTNMLGPIFILNPELALEVLKVCAKRKGLELKDKMIDMSLEKKGRDARINLMKTKKTKLKNAALPTA